MSSRETLVETITGLLKAQQIVVEPDDPLLTGGYVDSIAMMRLIGEIERETETKIPAEALVPENFLTVRTMAEFVASLDAGK